jgi:hypothetical protein
VAGDAAKTSAAKMDAAKMNAARNASLVMIALDGLATGNRPQCGLFPKASTCVQPTSEHGTR